MLIKYNLHSLLFKLVLFVPLINAVADTTINFFDRSEGLFHLGLIRGVFLILIIVVFLIRFGIANEKVSILIILFLIYLAVILPTSSNFIYSFLTGYIKIFSSFLLFPMGFFFFRTPSDLHKLSKVIIWSAVPVIANLIFAQVYKIGASAYLEDSFYYGGANIGITNTISFILLFIPIYFLDRKKTLFNKNWLVFLIIFIGVFFIIMITKRSAIIGLFIGYIIYLMFSPRKISQIKFIILGVFIILLTFPFYTDQLNSRIELRTSESNEITNEGRYKEIFYVLKEFQEGSVFHKLFGTEPFNSGEHFGVKYFRRKRMIHGDLSSFFYGTGLLGFSLYLSIFMAIAFKSFSFYKVFYQCFYERELTAVLFGILACGFFITSTGSGTIGDKGLLYLSTGAIIGVLRNQSFERIRLSINKRTSF